MGSTDQTPNHLMRNHWHRFSEFDAFESVLREQCRQDSSYRTRLVSGSEPWMKLRSEEVFGALHLARALGWQEGEYKIAEANAAMDIEIRDGPNSHRLQITTAGPVWPKGSSHWGRDHKLQMEQLRKNGHSSGWGPFRRLPSGEIVNNESAISRSIRDNAYRCGLTNALSRKSTHQSADLELVVEAVDYQVWEPETFISFARHALDAIPMQGFAAVHFVTGEPAVYYRSR